MFHSSVSVRNLRLLHWLLLALTAAGVLISCSSDDCTGNKNALPLAAFMNSDSTPKPISISALTVYGLDNPFDSLLVDNTSASQVSLPFRIHNDSSSFVFRYSFPDLFSQDIADTITFHYTVRPMFVSSACGATFFFDNVTATHTSEFIDSVRIPAGKITNANSQNIFIYFRLTNDD